MALRLLGRRTAALGAQRRLVAGARVGALRSAVQMQPLMLEKVGGARWFSKKQDDDEGDMHPDFAAQSKVQADDDAEVQAFLGQAVKEHDVLLFMKGTPQAPRCGFSAQVVRVLQNEGIDFSSADVLSSTEIREGIKKFSDWPTIPQLYVSGSFIGGCDIVVDMHTSGELEELLKPIKDKQEQENKE